jgi:hypothetical protein
MASTSTAAPHWLPTPPIIPTAILHPIPLLIKTYLTQYMPAHGHSMAPLFNSNLLNISCFFEDVDILGDDAAINTAAKIKHSLRYASLSNYEIWSCLSSSKAADWTSFQAKVVALYLV